MLLDLENQADSTLFKRSSVVAVDAAEDGGGGGGGGGGGVGHVRPLDTNVRIVSNRTKPA